MGAARDEKVTITDQRAASQLSAEREMVEAFRDVAGKDYVKFDPRSFELSNPSKFTLERQALWLIDNPSVPAKIIGSGDDRHDARQNEKLALRRARAVRDYLRLNGVADKQLQISSQGLMHTAGDLSDSPFGIAITVVGDLWSNASLSFAEAHDYTRK